jgi:hypothetical protein
MLDETSNTSKHNALCVTMDLIMVPPVTIWELVPALAVKAMRQCSLISRQEKYSSYGIVDPLVSPYNTNTNTNTKEHR